MATGLLSPVHLAFLLAVLLMLFGAKRLPEMGRSLGASLRGLKESLEGNDDKRGTPLAGDRLGLRAATMASPLPAQPAEGVGERSASDAAA